MPVSTTISHENIDRQGFAVQKWADLIEIKLKLANSR
jgi:hypothetical protein